MANALSPLSSGGELPGGAYPESGSAGRAYRPHDSFTESMSMRDLVHLIERHKLMILSITAIVTLAVLAQQLFSPNLYSSVAHAQVELIDEVGTNLADVNSRNEQRVANAVRMHRSRSAAERVIQDLDLMNDPDFLRELGPVESDEVAQRQAATNQLLEMVDVTSEQGSDLLRIAVTSRSPELSARIANQLPDSVSAVRTSKSDKRREELLASLVDEQKARSEAAQKAAKDLADFRNEAQMLVGAGSAADLAQINGIQAEAVAASAASAGSASRSVGVARAAAMRSTAQATSAAVQQLERQQADLVAEKARLVSTYGPNHPDVVRVNSELASVNSTLESERERAKEAAQAVADAEGAQMTELARSQAANDAARAARLQSAVSALTSQAYQNNANSVKLSQLERAAELADNSFASISERIEQVRAQMQLEGVNTMLVSPAVANYDRISPSPVKMSLVAMMGSFIVSLLLALGIDLVDNRLRTSAQVRRIFGLPTLGMLPIFGKGISENIDQSPVFQDPQSIFAEAARSTYSELMALPHQSATQTVLVTSPLPGDGKSTVSLTMAAAAVAMGKRAVVVDLDLRKRGLLQKLQNELTTPDIVDVITGKEKLENLLPGDTVTAYLEGPEDDGRQEREEMHIALLSANRPVRDPATILTGRRINALMAELRERFDLVVINAPAALAVRDARAMCDFTDQTVIVSRWGKTTVDQMKATLEVLGGQAAGVIFDHVDYAEHARRKYGDSVQFYVESSDYYSDEVPPKVTMLDQLRRFFSWRPSTTS